MSRAFVKEPDGEPERAEVPERLQSPHPNYVTPAGLLQLQERVRQLAALCDELIGDGAEEKRLRYAARDLRYYEERLGRALPVDPADQPADEVRFGTTVEVESADDQRRVFTIVGEDEAEAARGRVSWVSPLARALMGGRVGDTVTWVRPAGDLELTIVGIRKPGA
jgi:transcription elongation GreA/GreB family factor